MLAHGAINQVTADAQWMFDPTRNHFELFGLPVAFVIDGEALAQRYRELQKVVHPDRYASADPHSRRLSMQGATLVNEAYETLRDPLLRARYLLSLRGVDIDTQRATISDPLFLVEQMELREALAGVRDAADPGAEIDAQLRHIENLIKALVAELAVTLESPDDASLQAAIQAVQKMQFLVKLHAEAEAVEVELEEAG